MLERFDVRLDDVGHYEVFVGNAWLPDGLPTERSATLADPRPTTFWIDEGVGIAVRDACVGGCPRLVGVVQSRLVRVVLVFDVIELDPGGAVLEVRDLVVR